MKYIEDSEDLEFPYCKKINDNNIIPIQDKPNPQSKRKYLYIIIIILCIIILGLAIFLIIYFSKEKNNTFIINIDNPKHNGNNENNQDNQDNYIKAKYYVNSTNKNITFYLPEDTSIFYINETGNEVRDLGEETDNIDNQTKPYPHSFSKNGNITIKIIFNEAIESISNMFLNQTNLIEVDFSNFNSSNINSMESTFLNCTSLERVNFINFDSSNILSMNNAFENCIRLSELNLSSFNITNLGSMDSTFKNCESLTLLDLSGFELDINISHNDVFLNVYNLKLIIPNDSYILSWLGENTTTNETSNCTIGDNQLCKSCDENTTHFCNECNEGYTLTNITYPTKCRKVQCFVENCESCNSDYSCNKCIDGYNLTEENECIQPKSDIPTSELIISSSTSDMATDSKSDTAALASTINTTIPFSEEDSTNSSTPDTIINTTSDITTSTTTDITTLSSFPDSTTSSIPEIIDYSTSNSTSL